MKNKFILIVIILFNQVVFSFSQDKCGIYLNAKDFRNQKVSYAFDCNKGGNKIILHDVLWDRPSLTVMQNDQKITLDKNDIYGFRDADNVYRFFNNVKYCIAEPGDIYIYTRNERDAQCKVFKLVTVYYFSVAANSQIIPLSLLNLKRAYRDNEKFIDLLDENFNKSSLSEYDDFHKTYKLNHIYHKTTKGNIENIKDNSSVNHSNINLCL